MKEADLQRWIVDVAHRFGWHVWHVPAPMRMGRGGTWIGATEGAGLPDLVMLHDSPPRLLFLEVKAKGGKLNEAQQDFLQRAKLVADTAWTPLVGDLDGPAVEPAIGVHAVWPGQEEQIEQMLRTKVVT